MIFKRPLDISSAMRAILRGASPKIGKLEDQVSAIFNLYTRSAENAGKEKALIVTAAAATREVIFKDFIVFIILLSS
ncbi:hypothetical protein GCM10027340_27390 [Marinomonas epiphytica]